MSSRRFTGALPRPATVRSDPCGSIREVAVNRRRTVALASAVALVAGMLPATLAAPAALASPAQAAPGAARAAVSAAPKIVWSGPGTFGIAGVAVSPDGRTVATASADN